MADLNIKEIKYFKDVNTDYVIDSLTGVISRQYIIDIAQKLISEKTPFALMISVIIWILAVGNSSSNKHAK